MKNNIKCDYSIVEGFISALLKTKGYIALAKASKNNIIIFNPSKKLLGDVA